MRYVKVFQLLGAGAVLLFLLGSCAPGISIEMAEEMKADIEEANSRIAAIEEDLLNLEQANDDEIAEVVSETVPEVKQELSMLASTLTDIESKFDEFLSPVDEEPPMPADDMPAAAPNGF